MMTTAFEILLDLPKNKKKKKLIKYFEESCNEFGFKKLSRNVYNNEVTINPLNYWTIDFYDLRSKIVHGDTIENSDFIFSGWITHLIIADIVLWLCIFENISKVITFCKADISKTNEIKYQINQQFIRIFDKLKWLE